jgi:hypothetical protein
LPGRQLALHQNSHYGASIMARLGVQFVGILGVIGLVLPVIR